MELNPFLGVKLRMSTAMRLVKMVKISTFVPKSTGAKEMKDTLLNIKHKSRLNFDDWTLIRGKSNVGGQFLVINIFDEDSL